MTLCGFVTMNGRMDGRMKSCVYHFPAQIIFRFALALFKYKEEEFLKLQESTAIFKYLRCFTRTILDSRYSNMQFVLVFAITCSSSLSLYLYTCSVSAVICRRITNLGIAAHIFK